ncbi:MAG: glutamate racemase [Flavobacteriales bacterium]|nr:glutamate racemase [Flavobacteriales bacterium]
MISAKKENPIGIFDSGIGGLTIANAIKKVLPNENIIYFGDTEHLPYGEKSNEAIKKFSNKIIDFLIAKQCKIIIIACNSAASVTEKELIKYKNIVPIYNVIDPVVQVIIDKYQNSKIGVIGTKATIGTNIYAKKIHELCGNIDVCCLATPLLAPMIEEGFISEDISQTIISNYLSHHKLKKINHLVLACTHYPLIEKEISNYFNKKVNIIDSSKITANYIYHEITAKNLLNKASQKKHHFYVSNYTHSFENSAKFFFEKAIKLEEVKLFNH